HCFTSENVRRLRREAEIGRRLDSEHICRAYHIGVEQGAPFLVMECLEGETLRSRLRREGRLPLPEALATTMQILAALASAHEAGVIHRDIKPSNVFVTTTGSIKVIDFGIAKTLSVPGDDETEEEITTADTVLGTPKYLTPEQVLGERQLDARVDVW